MSDNETIETELRQSIAEQLRRLAAEVEVFGQTSEGNYFVFVADEFNEEKSKDARIYHKLADALDFHVESIRAGNASELQFALDPLIVELRVRGEKSNG